jgi:hypothetical protein
VNDYEKGSLRCVLGFVIYIVPMYACMYVSICHQNNTIYVVMYLYYPIYLNVCLMVTGESCSVEKELESTRATIVVYQDKTSILFSVMI